MADFSALKTAIQANIRTNGNEEITGAILQEVLLSMVSTMGDGAINALAEALQAEITNRQNAVSGEATTRAEADSQLGGRINAEATARGEADTQLSNSITAITTRLNEGYVYAGIATPSTNPGTPAGKVFYIALQAGTYTNFSSLAVTQGITILKYNGTAWSQEQLIAIDDVPTAGSNNLVKSGGVLEKIKEDIEISKNKKNWLTVSDEYGNKILEQKNYLKIKEDGEIETAAINFDNVQKDNFKVADVYGNIILQLLNYLIVDANGDIHTDGFNMRQDVGNYFVISDANLKKILELQSFLKVDKDGIIQTESFSSAFVKSLKGLTGVWIGTSIPAQGYPQIFGEKTGMTIHNEAIGSSMCRKGRVTLEGPLGDDLGLYGVPWQNACLSLSMSQEEKLYMFRRWSTENRKRLLIEEDGYTAEEVQDVVGYGTFLYGTFVGEDTQPTSDFPANKPIDIMNSAYVNTRKASYRSSWNNSNNIEFGFGAINGVIEKYLNQESFPDMWFIDHGHNDGLYQDNASIAEIPTDLYDRRYFIGSVNFIVNKILQYNPRAKFCFIGHYTNQTGGTNYPEKVCEGQEKIASLWQEQLVKCWEFLPFSQRVVTTTGYWDSNHVWHDTGFNGTNHVGMNYSGIDQNPRQVGGVWVHDLTMKQVYMWDDLHPSSEQVKMLYADSIINNLN